MKNKNIFCLNILGKKMIFKNSDFPNIIRMLSYNDLPPAVLLSRKHLHKKEFPNEGGKFYFKNSSAKAFFMKDVEK